MNGCFVLGPLLSVLLLSPGSPRSAPVCVSSSPRSSAAFAIPLSQFDFSTQRVRSEAFGRAAEAFKRKNYPQALAVLDAELKEGEDPEVLNLRGAVLTEMKRFDEARPCFLRVLELSPGHFWAGFNLAECELLAGRTESAREKFQALKAGRPAEDELLELKIVLSHLVARQVAEARKRVDALPVVSVTAAGDAARAAVAFYEGDKAKAREWLARAEDAHPGEMEGFLRTTLEEAGLTAEAIK